MENSMMNQTYKELREIARAENVPYSKTSKGILIKRIQHYRDTVDTLYRGRKKSLKAIAKAEGVRGYGSLNKRNFIDTILYHRRVVRPQIDGLRQLRKDELKRLAREEGLEVIGSKKDRIAQNIARHRVFGRRNAMRNIVEDIAGEEYKAVEKEGAFNGNFRRFKSKGVEGMIVNIEEYLQKTRSHVLKIMRGLVKNGYSWKINLKIAVEFVNIHNPEDKIIKPIQGLSDTIMLGSDLEEW